MEKQIKNVVLRPVTIRFPKDEFNAIQATVKGMQTTEEDKYISLSELVRKIVIENINKQPGNIRAINRPQDNKLYSTTIRFKQNVFDSSPLTRMIYNSNTAPAMSLLYTILVRSASREFRTAYGGRVSGRLSAFSYMGFYNIGTGLCLIFWRRIPCNSTVEGTTCGAIFRRCDRSGAVI